MYVCMHVCMYVCMYVCIHNKNSGIYADIIMNTYIYIYTCDTPLGIHSCKVIISKNNTTFITWQRLQDRNHSYMHPSLQVKLNSTSVLISVLLEEYRKKLQIKERSYFCNIKTANQNRYIFLCICFDIPILPNSCSLFR